MNKQNNILFLMVSFLCVLGIKTSDSKQAQEASTLQSHCLLLPYPDDLDDFLIAIQDEYQQSGSPLLADLNGCQTIDQLVTCARMNFYRAQQHFVTQVEKAALLLKDDQEDQKIKRKIQKLLALFKNSEQISLYHSESFDRQSSLWQEQISNIMDRYGFAPQTYRVSFEPEMGDLEVDYYILKHPDYKTSFQLHVLNCGLWQYGFDQGPDLEYLSARAGAKIKAHLPAQDYCAKKIMNHLGAHSTVADAFYTWERESEIFADLLPLDQSFDNVTDDPHRSSYIQQAKRFLGLRLYKLYSELNCRDKRPFSILKLWDPSSVRVNGLWPTYTVRLGWIWKAEQLLNLLSYRK